MAIRPLFTYPLSVRGICRKRRSCISSDGKAEVGDADYYENGLLRVYLNACVLSSMFDISQCRGDSMAQSGVGIFLAPNRTGQFIVTRIMSGGPAQRYDNI
jgi:hypothetical protein